LESFRQTCSDTTWSGLSIVVMLRESQRRAGRGEGSSWKVTLADEVEHDTMPFLVTSALELTDEKNAEVMEAIKVFSK
jgi:hypothetical protein